ncbi:peptidoglycan DD-metalloendopeptidase family protein [Desulfothermus naphthae]
MTKKIYLSVIFLIFLVLPHVSQGFNDSYKKQLIQKKSELTKRQKELKKLKQKEKKIYNEILHIEKNIDRITASLKKNNKKLINLQKKESELKKEIRSLQKDIKSKSEYLYKILNMMWETYLRKFYLSTPQDFKDIHLKYIWLEYIYQDYNNKLKEIRKKQKELENQQKKLETLKIKIKLQTKKIEEQKDELLKEKMVLFSKLQNVRALSIKKEKQIEEIIETVEKLKYNLRLLKTKKFKNSKGLLPYPVKGQKIKKIKKGVIIYAAKGSTVKACFSGKVVFQDKLRGFGNVVIIYHGEGYYTLYAFLSKVFVKMGQVVEGSRPIGEVGFSPFVRTYGLYFEIRKGKKILNPMMWFNTN